MPSRVNTLTVPALFDAHVHVRQGANLPEYVMLTARVCDRAIIMPNTDPPILNADDMLAYLNTIEAVGRDTAKQVSKDLTFTPYMTLYLTPKTTTKIIKDCVKKLSHRFVGVKIYPKHGTTASAYGLPPNWFYTKNDIDPMPQRMWDVLRCVADNDKVVLVHGEDNTVRRLDKREDSFVWSGFMEKFFEKNPSGKMTMEHISTSGGISHVRDLAAKGFKAGGSLTLHHMLHTLDDAYCQPHNCCWPAPLWDNEYIMGAARVPDLECFWLGSDSAPHLISDKHCVKAACGCFTSPVLAEKLAEIYAEDSWLDLMCKAPRHEYRMAKFTSEHASKFFGIEPSGRTITLVRKKWTVPEDIAGVRPWLAGENVQFSLKE